MRNLLLSLFVLLLISSCSQNKLDNGKALRLIVESKQYPKTIDFKVNTADPNLVSQLINSDLEKANLVTVEEPHSLGDMGSNLITFTSKANPYLLPTPEEEKGAGIQRVKIAEEVDPQVTNVQMSKDGKSAVVEYRTSYRNVTPFSALTPGDYKKAGTHKADFKLEGGRWKIVQ